MQKYTTVHSRASERFLNHQAFLVSYFRRMPLVKTSAEHRLSNGVMGLATYQRPQQLTAGSHGYPTRLSPRGIGPLNHTTTSAEVFP